MVRRSRFFSHTADPADELYIDEAISSETPVPLPECIRIRMLVSSADKNMITVKTILRILTNNSFYTGAMGAKRQNP
jgi:hypothetical protein